MSQPGESPIEQREDPNPHRRLQWVLGGRLIIATVLLGTTMYLALDAIRYGRFTPTFLLILISAIYGSSILFGVWLLRGRRENLVAAAITTLDVLLITSLVYLTGGAGSIFSFLYGALILTAALTLGTNAAYFTAAASLACYALQGVALNVGWLPPPPDQPLSQYILSSRDFQLALVSNMVGITAVAVLASNLARRAQVAGAQLIEAQQSTARLVRLNDDIVRSIASGLITADDDGRILGVNRAAQEILRDRAGTLLGAPLSNVLPNYATEPLREPPRRADATGRRADGSEFPMGYTLSALLDTNGNQSGLLLAFQDLTEIRTLRDRADAAQRLAVLGQLATGLAHEIRNPLSSISGSVEMVREGNALGPEDRRLLGIVISEVDRLNSLVTSMLQVGRPSQIETESLDLRAIASEVVAVARGQATASNGLQIDEVGPEEPIIVTVDPDRMRQVVWNLVKNAVQASPHRGKVEVRTGRDQARRAFLEVADEGPGIGDAHRERLFDMFYSGRTHGVGLGLAVVKQIVDQHQGHIEIIDRNVAGTCFRVTLPREEESVIPSSRVRPGERPDPRSA
ncbi:MAG: PAS domain-containing protein [Deltaproteobacteria bacterium]|nr:PAS domain-containing protein [Deltaproteobacteria bacterium]MBW2158525.1 PAS domain-containing protein [Deltaproteobacteria bacterium]